MESDYNYNQKFKFLCKLDGFLEKKSPLAVKGYQKRFFCIRDEGRILLYFKSQPNNKSQPIGFLIIRDLEAKYGEKVTDFVLTIQDDSKRDFIMRASSQEERNKWVDAIQFFAKHYENDVQRTKSQLFDRSKTNKSWKWKYVGKEMRINFQLEHERIYNEESFKKFEEENEKILSAKKITQFFEKNSDAMDNFMDRMICGFLFKNHGNNKLTEHLDKTKKRWFIMVMETPLNEDEDSVHDYISPFQLPPWMEFHKIYSFISQHDFDNSSYRKEYDINTFVRVEMQDIEINNQDIISNGLRDIQGAVKTSYNKFTEITMLDKLGLNYNSFDYGFKVITKKNKVINFYSQHLFVVDQWFKAIQKVIEINKQKNGNNIININIEPKQLPNLQQQQISSEKLEQQQKDDDDQDEEQIFREQQQIKSEIIRKTTIEIQSKSTFFKKLDIEKFSKYFVTLQRQIIKIYDSESSDKIVDIICLKNIKCEAQKNNQFQIQQEQQKDHSVFKFTTEKERDYWMRLINILSNNYLATKEELFPELYQDQFDNLNNDLDGKLRKNSDSSNTDSDEENKQSENTNNNDDQQTNDESKKSIYDKFWQVQQKQQERGIVINRSQSYLMYSKSQNQYKSGFQKFLSCICPCFFKQQRKSSKDLLIEENLDNQKK